MSEERKKNISEQADQIRRELDDLIGTPITGKGEREATIPGKCAAPPAPAMITLIPFLWAFLAKSTIRSGVR